MPEHIGHAAGTWGSETSQYPQEEKTTVIPRVVASESGTAQTNLRIGVVGLLIKSKKFII